MKFQNGLDCGGAYVKLLSKTDKLELVSSVVQEIFFFFQFTKLLLNFDCICISTSESNKEVLQAPRL